MGQSLVVPGRGEVQILSDEEKAAVEASQEVFRSWVESESPVDGLILNWTALLQEGSADEAVDQVGEFAKMFTAARILNYQIGEKAQPEFVQVTVQVIAGNLPESEGDE